MLPLMLKPTAVRSMVSPGRNPEMTAVGMLPEVASMRRSPPVPANAMPPLAAIAPAASSAVPPLMVIPIAPPSEPPETRYPAVMRLRRYP